SLELTRSGAYEVISRQEVERTAKSEGILLPLNETDAARLAKVLDVPLLITGEIREIGVRKRDGQREIEVGLVVHVKDVALGELVNGSAERGTALSDGSPKRPDVVALMDAA